MIIKLLSKFKGEFSRYNSILSKNINLFTIKSMVFTTEYTLISTLKYDSYYNDQPWVQSWFVASDKLYSMMLDNLFLLKNNNDESFSFRRSCREGICGSCAMNINGINTLACIKNMTIEFQKKYFIFPLPHLPIIKDVVVCMDHFYNQYKSINPFLLVKSVLSMNLNSLFKVYKTSLEISNQNSNYENVQSKSDRSSLDGLYECILCACCSTSCPSYWWNQDRYLGPAVLLQSYRWIIDSRDDFVFDRLSGLDDEYKLYRCHTILNCVQTCPKKLSPAKAISNIKTLIKLV